MLTSSKIKISQKFDGDMDGFSRATEIGDSSGISEGLILTRLECGGAFKGTRGRARSPSEGRGRRELNPQPLAPGLSVVFKN